MPLVILIVAILLVVSWYISTRNSFNRMIVKIDESESGIDVALTKRYDTLKKMLDICKRFSAHEAETLIKIIEKRKEEESIAQKSEFNTQMDEVNDRVHILAEAYPELKSSNNFIELQNAVQDVEDHLQAARRVYNANVSEFNQKLVTFPDSTIGSQLKLVKKEFFECEARKREDVDMLS